jgi:nucleoside-diphosphate-sugar epimerase
MRVAIFGGNRFVGRRVARRLVADGDEVTVVHRSPPSVPRARTIQGDRADPALLTEVLAEAPDAILDMSLFQASSARTLVGALGTAAIRYVAVSSAAIYSQDAALPWNEATMIEPAPGWGSYGREKAACDALVAAAGLADSVIVRPPYVVGAGDPDKRLDLVFGRLARGLALPLPGDGSAQMQVVHADDLASALVFLLRGTSIGPIDVPGTDPLTVREFDERCAQALGREADLRPVAQRSRDYLPERWPFPNLKLVVSGARFRRECSLRPRGLQTILGQAVDEHREGAASRGAEPSSGPGKA